MTVQDLSGLPFPLSVPRSVVHELEIGGDGRTGLDMETQARRHSSNGASTSSKATSPSYSDPRRSPTLPQPRSVPELHGRARSKAELNRLHQEIRLLEDELERLDALPPASEVCKQLVLLQSVESQSDPFIGDALGLPQWDRWFSGPPAQTNCLCCPSRSGRGVKSTRKSAHN